MLSSKIFKYLFYALIILYLAYAGVYITRSGFDVAGERYFMLNDDAMISMRYARNFARGYGLVWNPGEAPVEGYTNPLWVVYMAFWHLFPISLAKMSLTIQISGALFLALNLVFVRRIALLLTGNEWIALLAAFMTAFYEPLNNWGLLGMEVSVLVLLVSVATWLALKAAKEEKFSWMPYLILGIGTFVRIDMAVPFLAIWLMSLAFDSKYRKQHLLYGIGILVAALGSQTLFRVLYYGAALPNTYYLKVAGLPLGVRLGNGLTAFIALVWNSSWLLALLPFTVLLFRRDRATMTLIFIFGSQLAYSIYVGGDAWEHKGGANRYISLAIPIFFTLLVYAGHKIWHTLTSEVKFPRWLTAKLLANSVLAVFVLLSLFQFNAIRDSDRLLTCCPVKALVTTRAGFNTQIEFTAGNEEYVEKTLALMKFTTEDATIAVVTAGVIPYLSDLPAIDLLGKNDAYIAQLDSHLPNAPLMRLTSYRPGHSKWDYDYSIGELKPDVIVQIWDDADQASGYLEKYYTSIVVDGFNFSVRTDSAHILWDEISSP